MKDHFFLLHITRLCDTESHAENPHNHLYCSARPTLFCWSSQTWPDTPWHDAAYDFQRTPWSIRCQVQLAPSAPLCYAVMSRSRIYSPEYRSSPVCSSAENRTCLETWKIRRNATAPIRGERWLCAISSPSKQLTRTFSHPLLGQHGFWVIPEKHNVHLLIQICENQSIQLCITTKHCCVYITVHISGILLITNEYRVTLFGFVITRDF